jgi:hypothetical protein
MARYTMFRRPVTRAVHRHRMLRLLRLMTINGLRGTQVHKRQQISLVRNRLDVSWTHPRITKLIQHHERDL